MRILRDDSKKRRPSWGPRESAYGKKSTIKVCPRGHLGSLLDHGIDDAGCFVELKD